jgi:ribosomal protein L12E/L44/L45/RPP1/RPP2
MVSKTEHDELACVYAGLLLHDDKIEITAEKLNKVIAASGNTVEAYYPEFFAKYFKSVDLDKLLQNVGSAPAGPAASTPAAAAPEAKKEEKKDDKKGAPAKKEAPKKVEVEEDDDVGFGGLF